MAIFKIESFCCAKSNWVSWNALSVFIDKLFPTPAFKSISNEPTLESVKSWNVSGYAFLIYVINSSRISVNVLLLYEIVKS